MRRFLVTLVGVVASLLFAAGPAAAVGWSLATAGASGSGDYSRSGMSYYVSGRVTDTASDGSCAYVRIRPKVHYSTGPIGTWFTAGGSGWESRHEVCGHGSVRSFGVNVNVGSIMSAADRTFSDAYKIEIAVCRNVNNAGDNCDIMSTPPVAY